MRQRLVAITGGIASGKSTVTEYLKQSQFSVISADDVSRDLREDQGIRTEIADIAGLQENWLPMDLLQALSGSNSVRRNLDNFLHPLIWQQIVASKAEYVEMPLLFETALQHEFVEIWCVMCSEEIQRDRLRNRYGNDYNIEALLQTQLPLSAKEKMSDWTIRTDQPEETVRTLVLIRAGLIATSEA